jgi:hypothetical protein
MCGRHDCEVPSEDDNFGSVFMISEQNGNFTDKDNRKGN